MVNVSDEFSGVGRLFTLAAEVATLNLVGGALRRVASCGSKPSKNVTPSP
jgi:hypothetical protein